MNAAQIQDTLRAAGWPEDKIALMAAVSLAESSGNPRAVNPGTAARPEHSVGLLQINLHAHHEYTEQQLYDPLTNARAALQIYRHEGLHAWGAYTNGNYRKFLAQSQLVYHIPGSIEAIGNENYYDIFDSVTLPPVAETGASGAALLFIGGLIWLIAG